MRSETMSDCREHPEPQRCWDSRCAEDATAWFDALPSLGVCCGHLCDHHAEEFATSYAAATEASDVLESP